MATQSESETASWTNLMSEVQGIGCEQQMKELAESPVLQVSNDWTSTAREGIQDRRSRPDE